MNKYSIAIIIVAFVALSFITFTLYKENKTLKESNDNLQKYQISANDLSINYSSVQTLGTQAPSLVIQDLTSDPTDRDDGDKVEDAFTQDKQATHPVEASSIPVQQSAVRDKYLHEAKDSEWSYDYENNIINLFLNNSTLQKYNVQQVTCKTSICELQLFHSGESALMSGMTIAKALSEQEWRNQDAAFYFNHKIENGIFTLYLGKDKNSLELD